MAYKMNKLLCASLKESGDGRIAIHLDIEKATGERRYIAALLREHDLAGVDQLWFLASALEALAKVVKSEASKAVHATAGDGTYRP